jgi:hypothetical protein
MTAASTRSKKAEDGEDASPFQSLNSQDNNDGEQKTEERKVEGDRIDVETVTTEPSNQGLKVHQDTRETAGATGGTLDACQLLRN